MANQELRQYLKANEVRIWEVANSLKIHETTLVKKLRVELQPEFEQKVYLAIEEILLSR